MNEANINYTKEAFLHPWNLIFLIVAMAAAFGTSMIFPGTEFLFNTILLFTAALELLEGAYLDRGVTRGLARAVSGHAHLALGDDKAAREALSQARAVAARAGVAPESMLGRRVAELAAHLA